MACQARSVLLFCEKSSNVRTPGRAVHCRGIHLQYSESDQIQLKARYAPSVNRGHENVKC
eukprot:1017501-Prorocentrum_minimum.AAC.3